mgnify:CR=1 FL=1
MEEARGTRTTGKKAKQTNKHLSRTLPVYVAALFPPDVGTMTGAIVRAESGRERGGAKKRGKGKGRDKRREGFEFFCEEIVIFFPFCFRFFLLSFFVQLEVSCQTPLCNQQVALFGPRFDRKCGRIGGMEGPLALSLAELREASEGAPPAVAL